MPDPRLEKLSPEDAAEFHRLQEVISSAARRNPLLKFHACPKFCGSPNCVYPTDKHPEGGRPKQREYMLAKERIVLEAAGNRFGKTVGNVAFAIIQHTPDELLPDRLKEFKRKRPRFVEDLPVTGRYTAPSEGSLQNIVWPEFRRWVPTQILRGGSWEKAFTQRPAVLHFKDGGRLEFYTNEQNPAVRVGTSLDYAIFDEPVNKAAFGEDWVRLGDRLGQARFGLTPVNMKGGGIGWLYRDIYKKGLRGEPYEGTKNLVPRILRGTIHDNPTMTDEMIAETLAPFDPDERNARETGDFVAFAGLIYPTFKRYKVPKEKIDPKIIRHLDTIVGIDPSYLHCAIVWVAFNNNNHGLIYHEELVEKTSPVKIKAALLRGNMIWGLQEPPLYVMDPYAGSQHSMLGSTTIKEELQQLGVYTNTPKVLDSDAIVYGGISNIWRRMQSNPPTFAVSSACERTIDEAEEYRMDTEREDGVFAVIKENDHFMDAFRYAYTWRPYYPPVTTPNGTPIIIPGKAPAEGWNEGELEEIGDLL
jgi:hypothetical protein